MVDQLELLEFLNSRFCHDMAGPIGALSNGAEFLREAKPEMRNKAAQLIETSAQQSVVRLEFYKCAFGTALLFSDSSFERIQRLCTEFFDTQLYQFIWDESCYTQEELFDSKLSKLALNLILVASNTMIYGGKLKVSVQKEGKSAKLIIEAIADQLRSNNEINQVFFDDEVGSEDNGILTTNNAQYFYTKLLIERNHGKLTFDLGMQDCKLVLTMPQYTPESEAV